MTSEAMDKPNICPTEDAVHALLEYLVDRKLPAKSFTRNTLSQLDEESIAKQVHAVVLLYNYFYRKQHPQLEFLGFESFCKLAVILRSSLMAHMKLMQISSDAELVDLEKQLSLMEKKIMDACDISTMLDASINAPSTEGWPISKVAVLLVDSRKEKCFLQFSSITEGVWSVIEKDVDIYKLNSEGTVNSEHTSKRKKIIRKPLRIESIADEASFQQLAFSAVKEATGINQSDLMVLDSSVVYSTSKEKAAAHFYIMQCTQPNNNGIQLPIKEVIHRLQGSLFVKQSCRWTHTSVVEYFHLLPYSGMLLDWLSKEGVSVDIQTAGLETTSQNKSKSVENHCKLEVSEGFDRSNVNGSSVQYLGNNESSLKQNDADFAGFNNVEVNGSSVVHDRNIILKVDSDDFPKASTERCLNGPKYSDKVSHQVEMVNVKLEPIFIEDRDQIVANGNKKSNNNSSDLDKWPTSASAQAPVFYQSNLQDLEKVQATKSSRDKEPSQTVMRVFTRKKDKSAVTVGMKMGQIITEHRDDNVAGGHEKSNNISSDLHRRSINDHALVNQHSNLQDLNKVQAAKTSSDSELSQTVISVILRKRDKLSLQLRDIEDQIAECDKSIQTILNGGEDDLIQKIESVIEGCDDVCLRSVVRERAYERSAGNCSPQCIQRKRMLDAVLNIQNPCQELDDLCYENKWILPAYHVSAKEGGFHANVTVKEMDFECSSEAKVHSCPREARESAAAHMLAKLRK